MRADGQANYATWHISAAGPLAMSQYLAGPGNQRRQQPEFNQRQVNRLTVAGHWSLLQVNADFAKGNHRSAIRLSPPPPADRSDPRQQFLDAKQFNQIVPNTTAIITGRVASTGRMTTMTINLRLARFLITAKQFIGEPSMAAGPRGGSFRLMRRNSARPRPSRGWSRMN